jgi:3-oxoacyl-(acyl-carrier-protein) synthase
MNFKICKFYSRRVVVTGIGMVTPIGNNKSENWKNIKDYKIGIRDLSEEIYSKDLPSNCRIGATILSSFDAKKYKTLVNIFNIGN